MVSGYSNSVSSDDIPLIQPSRESQDRDIHGKKLKKEQPKKRQRGQKKPKKVKPIDNEPEITSSANSRSQIQDNAKVTRNESAIAHKPADVMSLPPKSTKKPRRRKDNYDPAELGQSVVTPSAARLEEVTRETVVKSSRVVQKPVGPSTISVRDRELNQLKRRYGTAMTIDEAKHRYVVPFVPSDPEFPYELPELQISLTVPLEYPSHPMILQVKSGLEVGFARNIERAFELDKVGSGVTGRGLLGMITWLDRNLERLLALKKSDTVKIVRPQQVPAAVIPLNQTRNVPPKSEFESMLPQAAKETFRPADYTPTELSEAKLKRTSELSKLRMIHPSRLNEDAFDLELTESVLIRLQVPKVFPLEPAWLIILQGDERVESEANKELRESTRGLARTLNWIGANFRKLQSRTETAELASLAAPSISRPEGLEGKEEMKSDWKPEDDGFRAVPEYQSSDATHSDESQDNNDSELESDDEDDPYPDNHSHITSSDTSSESDSDLDLPTTLTHLSIQPNQKPGGTAINVTLDMPGIALLDPQSITLSLKCLRCKSPSSSITFPSLSSSSLSTASKKTETEKQGEGERGGDVVCVNCSAVMNCQFEGLQMHQSNQSRLGHVSLSNASPLQLAHFSASLVCAGCSDLRSEAVVVVEAISLSQRRELGGCRVCHQKRSLNLQASSFLTISAPKVTQSRLKTKTGMVGKDGGGGLPRSGRCEHYGKSHRWFKFPCCAQSYPCPQCHDLANSSNSSSTTSTSASGAHFSEPASRMICGFCRREQSMSTTCRTCQRELIGKRSGKAKGYWEGGKGVREQSKMARGEKRKYRKKLG